MTAAEALNYSLRRWARISFALLVPLLLANTAMAADPKPFSLVGTWEMTAAYEIAADGTRTTTFGEHPHGLLMIDKDGRYTLQIFRPDRPKFASGDRNKGTIDEYRQAVLGSSTHFGHVKIDPSTNKLVFDIEAASYPNWEGTRQVRDWTFKDGILTYSVPSSAWGNGSAYSVWRHME